jgi:UDP-N-acetylmuramoyl-L-alanyl-D-glutamate--2,6-diaminopimelate ligase
VRLSSLVQTLTERGFSFAFTAAEGAKDPEVSGVFADSREICPDSVFCCIEGEKDDGHRYIPAAEAAGAAALVCERPVETGLPLFRTSSTRGLMGELAALAYGEPASKLFMVGVTGTNGKTTTTYILRGILQAAGLRTGLLGTVVESDGVQERDAERTTPESCRLQRLLAAMVGNGCEACVMEASSHGLHIGRLSGCRFDAVVFTNLSPEHLDYHKDMENYFQAKRLLFTKHSKECRVAAINADDPYGARLLAEFASPEFRPFSLSDASGTRLDVEGSSFVITAKGWSPLPVKSPLAGSFNVANVLGAATVLRGKLDDAVIAKGIASVPQAPGRLERHPLPSGACCVIDFAHTPEALRNVLSAARGFCSGKLVSIFGHGGGRYPSNRPALGGVAAGLADRVVVTMDNPRDEDPARIAEAIVQGIENSGREIPYEVILDRKEAITKTLAAAGSGDVLVVSGKGPEKFLTIQGRKIPYNDAETVDEWIRLAR